MVVTQYTPLCGSSFIATPPAIAKRKAVVNVQNFDDDRCFEYAILSHLYPPRNRQNACKPRRYKKYRDKLNFDNISFPVKLNQIPLFEKQIPDISVNIVSPDSTKNSFFIDYLSPEKTRRHKFNLLLLSDENTQHYVYIKNFSRLLGARTKYDGASYVCNSCLYVFSSQQTHDNHLESCMKREPQHVQYPTAMDRMLKFETRGNSFEHHFFLVIDFESFLKPVDQHFDADAKTRVVDEHLVSGFCCHRVTDLQQYQTRPTVYSGPNVMERFYEHLMSESKAINEILSHQLPLLSMSQEEINRYRASTECANCRSKFTHENYKVRHHDHVTDEFFFACCRNCNLQLKPKKVPVNVIRCLS